MQLNFKLDIAQKQKLILTQSMNQSINILKMSCSELREYIDEQIQENPVLELREIKEEFNCNDIIKSMEKSSYSQIVNNQYSGNDEISIFNFISQDKSLKDYLYEQLYELRCKNEIKIVIEYMIESLNSNGYLENTLENISNELDVSEKVLQEALEILQDLDPVGVGARNIKECLLIQLRSKGIVDEVIEEIILKYLEYIGDGNYNYIAKKLKITAKEVQAYGDIIKKLEPKPSRGYYTGEEVKFIIPDAYIIKIDNEYDVIMNNSIIPNITINDIYNNIFSKLQGDKEAEYIEAKVNQAKSLINNIEERNNTILKLLKCILEKQKDYFDKGKIYLKPMILKDIADDMGVHESTVSRAIKDKYILTSRGTVKIKELFCNGIENNKNNGESISINVIKDKIKKIIDLENKKRPLSDQDIKDLLEKENINISRRTITKYREELGIKSSTKRKKL